MKFLTIFAFACAGVILVVASFVVLHGVYGSPVPGPEPKPDPAPKAEPAPKPEPVANPKPVAVPNPANGPQPAAGGEGNFVALSANAEPMVPAPGTGSLKNDESLAI